MKIMTKDNNYLEDTDSCLYRDIIQKCTGEANEIYITPKNNISEIFSDSEKVLLKYKPVILSIHYPVILSIHYPGRSWGHGLSSSCCGHLTP